MRKSLIVFFAGISFFTVALILSSTAQGATDFFILPTGNTSDVHCEFLNIYNDEVSCKENRTLLVYSLTELSRITVISNSKKFVFEKEIKGNKKELVEAINLLNARKIEKAQRQEIERRRKIAQKREKEKRKRERAEQFQLEFEACRELYFTQCAEECAINNYQANRSCVNSCIEVHCL